MTALSPADATDRFRQPPDRFVDVGAGEVAVRTVGSGPDVLFVHGFPVSGATFRTLLPHLAEHVTCHVIDLPGPAPAASTPPRPSPSNSTSPTSAGWSMSSAWTTFPSWATTAAA
ncbi:MAG: hypothetical protein R2702_00415 [Acidimicrobiales bacterium]